MTTATAPSERLGVISTNELYPIQLFKNLTGLSDWAFKRAQRRGLKVRRVGRRRYIRGEDWAAFLSTIEA